MSGITWELLDQYLAHQCADVERELVERWLEQDYFRSLIPESLSEATFGVAVQGRAMSLFQRRFGFLTAIPLERPGVIHLRLPDLVALAAAATGAVLIGWQIYLRSSHDTSQAAAVRVATTPPGQRATLHLADGTRVMLGVASTLRSPAEFGPGSREVELTGEAYFEVAPDESRPFVVRAADLEARDIGTAFLVRAYPDDRHARIVVREGRVAMRAARNPDSASVSLIAPGQVGQLDANGTPVVEQADTTAYFSWIQGRLTIDNTPLRDALPQLGRWYDLDFHLADSAIGHVPLTATLGSRLTPDVLDLLARSLGLRQERVGRTVTFYPATGSH